MDADSRPSVQRFRLTGTRFEGGRLPIDSLVELQKYQDIVRIAAEAKWRQDHGNEDLPEDFHDSISLTIERIDEGSADVFLAFEQQHVYVEYQAQAQDAADAVIIAAYSDAPIPELPALSPERDREFREVTAQLGATLVVGQSIEIYPEPDGEPVSITVETRPSAIERLSKIEDFLVPPNLATPKQGLQTIEATLVARVTTLYAEKDRFDFVLPDGREMHGWYRDYPALLEDLRKVVNPAATGPLTRISGSLQLKYGQPWRFWEVNGIELVHFDDTAWGSRLTEFASYLPGWYDGAGETITSVALDGAQKILQAADRADIGSAGVFPTEHGGVLIEWANAERVRSIEVLPEGNFEMFALRKGDLEGTHLTGNLADAVAFLKADDA